MKKILITGASGMLGAAMVKEFAKDYNVFATGNSNFEKEPKQYLKFNLEVDSYTELIRWANPDVIVHCGAITNGNFCDKNSEVAFNVNGLSTKKIIEATADSVKIIYISTDAVFPSSLSDAKETDCVHPENVYGKSKEIGEFFLINSDREYCVIRTTIVGLNSNTEKQGFVEWIINSSLNNESIGLFDDVTFTPISIWDLITEVKFLISDNTINSEILHIGGASSCTKYDFGISLLKALNLNSKEVQKSSILKFSERAKRSMDQSMDTTYYQEKYRRKLPVLADTIQSIKNNYNE